MKKDQKAARRELAKKFQGNLAKVETTIGGLKEAKEIEVDLVQIDSNLQFIGILHKDDALTLDSEVARLTEWRADLEGANEEFERIATRLRDELKLSPISLDIVGSFLGNESVENAAANISVRDFSGSNFGTPVVTELAAEKATEASLLQ